MNNVTVFIIAFGALLLGGGVGLVYFLRPQSDVKNLLKHQREAADALASTQKTEDAFHLAKERLLKNKKYKKPPPTEAELMFQAGVVSDADKAAFKKKKLILPLIFCGVLGYGGSVVSGQFIIVGAVMGILVGLQAPKSLLQRKINARSEEIMFFLPLVVEQIAIGVSSSLDIGPCLQKVVQMATERDSHNVVTEYLLLVTTLARTGLSLDAALTDVGLRSGHLELGQTFNAMAQVLKHGGEITKQLQEMADAVSSQRETKIEAKIKKLELEATGPVALVFMGFLAILLTCIGMQMMKAFG